jgi:hypothetical protein
VGTEIYQITVRDLTGDERNPAHVKQARRYPGFAGYAHKTEGIRTIPVLELRRSWRAGVAGESGSGQQCGAR